MRLTTLGDLVLDVVVRLDEPLVPGDDRMASTHTSPGGQAANVAAWAVAVGTESRLVARTGDDAAGEIVRRDLVGRGVQLAGPIDGRTGVVVSIAAAGDRTMVSDRGNAPELSPRDLDPAWFDCDVLHVSGYALLLDPFASAAEEAARLARSRGAQVSLDVSTFTLVDDAFRTRARALAPDVVFATERERDAVRELDARWVVKRGALGVLVDGVETPAPQVEVVDATGAGDALAAGFLVGGAQLGVETAARCVARVGAMP